MSARGMDAWLQRKPLHPVLLALFFMLYNIRELDNYVTFGEVAISIAVLLPLALLLTALARPALGSWRKAGIVASMLLVLLLFYRDIYYALDDVFGAALRHRLLLPALLGAVLLAAALLRFNKRSAASGTHYLNLLLTIITVVELGRVGYNHLNGREWKGMIALEGKHPTLEHVAVKKPGPDIYFILLDAYTNPNSLPIYWGFDNSPFTDFLQERGFYWSEEATSNYNVTQYSMASMLNMEYLPDLWSNMNNTISWETILRVKINNSEVAQRLARHGYEVVNYSLFDVGGASHYIDYDYLNFHGLSLYEHLFKKSAPGKLYADTYFSSLSPTRARDLFKRVQEEAGKRNEDRSRFVYAHLILPHRPFYYDAEGNVYEHGFGKYPDDPIASYLEQLQYTNKLVQATVDSILEKTNGNAVILLQGDHGYRGFKDRAIRDLEGYSILNALYLPNGKNCEECYPSVSGVNTFRVLLNELFNEQLPYLEDYPDKRMHKDLEDAH